MSVSLYNSLTKTVAPVTPLTRDTFRIYSCGPTVYDYVHIGNLSAFIAADTLRRALQLAGFRVQHTMNFTDVDDKTIRRSAEMYPETTPNEALANVTTFFGEQFLQDMATVGNDTSAYTFIRATSQPAMAAMQSLITKLVNAGIAYIADDGIYFSIATYQASGKTYGQLTELDLGQADKRQRINNDEYDKDAAHDFALWKLQKPGEPAWDFVIDGTNYAGRPGWHIECSAMSQLSLGLPFDIHTGGIDLAFPHHENEIAQSTALADDPHATYAALFLHNEHILVDGKKMSKSLHNFLTLRDLTEKGIDPLAFRLLVLQSHYRKSTLYSDDTIHAAGQRLAHWRQASALRWQTGQPLDETATATDTAAALQAAQHDTFFGAFAHDFSAALWQDLNTAAALTVVDTVIDAIEKTNPATLSAAAFDAFLSVIDGTLGLDLRASSHNITPDLQQLITKREAARARKDWSEADRIRDALAEQKIAVRDTASGSQWYWLA